MWGNSIWKRWPDRLAARGAAWSLGSRTGLGLITSSHVRPAPPPHVARAAVVLLRSGLRHGLLARELPHRPANSSPRVIMIEHGLRKGAGLSFVNLDSRRHRIFKARTKDFR